MLLVISTDAHAGSVASSWLGLLFSLLLAALTPPVPLSSRSLLARFTFLSLSFFLSHRGRQEREGATFLSEERIDESFLTLLRFAALIFTACSCHLADRHASNETPVQ